MRNYTDQDANDDSLAKANVNLYSFIAAASSKNRSLEVMHYLLAKNPSVISELQTTITSK